MNNWFGRMLFFLATTGAAAMSLADASPMGYASESEVFSIVGSDQHAAHKPPADAIQGAPEIRVEGKALAPMALYDRLMALLEKLNPKPTTAADLDKGWQVKLRNSEATPAEAGGNSKPASGTILGLNLHLKF